MRQTDQREEEQALEPPSPQALHEADQPRQPILVQTKEETREEKTTNKWAVLGIVAIGIFMATLDTSIVNISLPSISAYFQTPLNGLIEWVIIAYLITIASVLLTFGRLSDMFGRKILWMVGLAAFTLGSALCAPRHRCCCWSSFAAVSRAWGARSSWRTARRCSSAPSQSASGDECLA